MYGQRKTKNYTKKSNYNNINKMVTTIKARLIAIDTGTILAADLARGKKFSGTRAVKIALADSIYQYALIEKFQEYSKEVMSTKSAAGASDELLAKFVGLGLSMAAVTYASGSGLSFTNVAIDAAVATAGGYILEDVIPKTT